MTVIELLAAARALLEAAELVLGKDRLEDLRAQLEAFVAGAPLLEEVWEFVQRVAVELNLGAHEERKLIVRAARQNPNIVKGSG